MPDLKDPRLMWLKFWMFLFIGAMSAALLLFESPHWKVALYLALTVWAFCRAYYFTFYVIQHYIDPNYRFAGLIAFFQYLFRRQPGK